MKVFISADIEGCCGVFSNIETHKNEAVYAPFAKQMTKEVLAVCEAAHEAGADEIVVKDGHGDASNIDPLQMPSYVTLIRGKSGHPYNMMFGLDPTFDAVLYVGYHAAAGVCRQPYLHWQQPVYHPQRKAHERVYAQQLHGGFLGSSCGLYLRGRGDLRRGKGAGAGDRRSTDQARSRERNLLLPAGNGHGSPQGADEGGAGKDRPVPCGASGKIRIRGDL